MSFEEQVKFANEVFINSVLSGEIKTAQEQGNVFLRRRVREDGVAREIIPPVPITKEDLTQRVENDQPGVIVEMEPSSPGAMSMTFQDNNPPFFYIRGKRFWVDLFKISSRPARKSEVELATWRSDVKALLAEMLVKDLSWEEDATFINSCNTLLGGVADGTNIMNGLVQWREINGGIDRTTIMDAFRYAFVPPSRIPITKILCNGATLAELAKMDRIELGGDDAQNILYEGWSKRPINNATVIGSIKRELIEDDTMYFFGDGNFIGRFFVFMEPSLYIKKEDDEIQFRAREVIGMAIGHGDGVHRFDFVTT